MPLRDDWQPQLRYSNNLDSMQYAYHISAPKPPGRTFATHFDLLSKTPPSFSTGDWHQLPNGSSRDHYIEKWLATSKTAKVMVETDGGLNWRDASKGSIVLSDRPDPSGQRSRRDRGRWSPRRRDRGFSPWPVKSPGNSADIRDY
jgi:hypothetical protein